MWYAQRNVIISLVTVFVVLPMCFPRCALIPTLRFLGCFAVHHSTAFQQALHRLDSSVGHDCVLNAHRNLSSLHWISTAGVCGFIYTAIAIVYESSKVRGAHLNVLSPLACLVSAVHPRVHCGSCSACLRTACSSISCHGPPALGVQFRINQTRAESRRVGDSMAWSACADHLGEGGQMGWRPPHQV